MGLFRFLFALSIVIFHLGFFSTYNIGTDSIAVLSFFIISGFYMSLILNEKYSSNKSFYINRFLRIFPIYWGSLAIFVILAAFKSFSGQESALSHYLAYYPSSSYFQFLVDSINFILRNILLIVNLDYFYKPQATSGFLFIQQAWTLQIELLFYLIAPFLVRINFKNLFILISIYMITLYSLVLPQSILPPGSLSYMFSIYFIYFVLGIFSYKIYSFIKKKRIPKFVPASAFILMTLYLLTYHFIPIRYPLDSFNIPDFFYFSLFILSVPFIFIFSKNLPFDSFIGSLSYPIYIFHIISIKIGNVIFPQKSMMNSVFVLVFSIGAAILMFLYIEKPINKFRQRQVE